MKRNKKQVAAEMQREEQMRLKMYPKWIQGGTLNKDRAAVQLADLATVIKLLTKMTEKEFETILNRAEPEKVTQGDLFK